MPARTGRRGLYPHTELILDAKLQMAGGKHVRLRGNEVKDVAPHWWREEADDFVAWFVQTCGGYDVRAEYRLDGDCFDLSPAVSPPAR
jgi:hypothetical protein